MTVIAMTTGQTSLHKGKRSERVLTYCDEAETLSSPIPANRSGC